MCAVRRRISADDRQAFAVPQGGRDRIPILLIVGFALIPYAWMLLTSIKPDADITARPLTYLPSAITFEHYETLLNRTTFAANLLNSLIVAIGAVLVGLGVSIPAAYAFSRFRFPGRNYLMTQFLVINMFRSCC